MKSVSQGRGKSKFAGTGQKKNLAFSLLKHFPLASQNHTNTADEGREVRRNDKIRLRYLKPILT